MKKNKKILIFTCFYLPGFKGGGPIRTIANMVEYLGDEINFSVVTLDRDLGDSVTYPSVNPDDWQRVGKALVYYSSPANSFKKILRIILDFKGDALHLNGFFSFQFSILPLLISHFLKIKIPIIIGPRGEFSEGALALKSLKKKSYISLAKLLGFYKNVIWHASTSHEAEDIRRVMGNAATVRTAIDIAAPAVNLSLRQRKEGEHLRIIFVSRISPMKNLLGAIEVLKKVKCPVDFHVYGPIEEKNYWNECQLSATSLPSHIFLSYNGPLQPDAVAQKLAGYDLFFLPTLGENFGHVIAEALSAGLPALISNKTPWRNLESMSLGWDLPLEQTEAFARSIEICHAKPVTEYNQWRQNIRAWALDNIGNQEAVEQNCKIFMNLKASDEY